MPIKVQDTQVQERLQTLSHDAIVALAKKQLRRELSDSIRKQIWYQANREKCIETNKLRYRAMKEKADRYIELLSASPGKLVS